MAKFQFSVTPPRPGSEEGRLSPRSWLRSSNMLPTLESLGLLVTERDQAMMGLDPQYREVDRTIDDYHQQDLGMLPEDGTKIPVPLPAEPSIREILNQHTAAVKEIQKGLEKTQSSLANTQSSLAKTQTSLTKTQTELVGIQVEVSELQVGVSELRVGMSELRVDVSELRTDQKQTNAIMEELLDRAKHEDRLRFTALKANLMTEFVKKLSVKQKVNIPEEAKGKNDPLHDSTIYINAASTLYEKFTAQEFKARTGLDPAYRVFLGNCRKFVEARREWAHETDEEYARFLLSRQFQEEPFRTKENVEQWEKLLLWVSGKESLEEIVNGVAMV